jgi:ribosomal protein S12 methylthiotransferase accessory factor
MNVREIPIHMGDGLKVSTEIKGHVIETDQPARDGGGGAAPAPFDLFLASLATCAGFYVLAFCRERQIPVEGIGLKMSTEKGEVSKRIDKITFTVDLPSTFPEKYKFALVKAIDHCTVKNHILVAPQFEIITRATA